MQTVQEQLDEIKELYNKGIVSEALYISTRATLNASLGTDFRRDGIMLNVNPVAETVKDKKVRGGGVIEGGGNKIKGGLVNLSPEKNSPYTGINKLYINVETMQWIIKHGDQIIEYLSQDHMTYRKIGQTTIEQGCLTASELFS